MPDIVAELRASAVAGTHVGDAMLRAAREIERLRAPENALEGTGQHDTEQYLGKSPVGNEAWETDQGVEYRRSMDLRPIFRAAMVATGSDPEAKFHDAADLQRAQRALRIVDEKINEELGYTKLAEVTIRGKC